MFLVKILPIVCWATLAGCVGAEKGVSADVEVTPKGNVKTPQAALERVKALRAAGRIPVDRAAVVKFAPGVYELADTFTVTSDVAPIRFVGAGDDKSVLSAGRRLGPFTAGGDGVWRCKVPAGLDFDQAWINGARATRAKSPNKFYHYVLAAGGEETDPLTGQEVDMSRRLFTTDPKSVACLANLPQDELEDAVIHVWWAWDDEWRHPVKVDAAKGEVVLRTPVGRAFFMWAKWCPRFTIENCRTALDAPGEWFLDKKAGELLYVPRAGERPETSYATVPALDVIVSVSNATSVVFENLTFAHNGFKLPAAGLFPHQSAVASDAAIHVAEARQVVFRNCHVTHTANYGLWFDEGAHDCAAVHSLFDDLGAGGVRFGARQWTTNTPPDKLVSNIVVDDNIITSGGHVFAAGTGVFITYARDSHVTHNEISDLYYSGICCGWRWGYAPAPNRNNELAWNHIHHLGKGVLSDMGFIYTLGDSRGTIVTGNHGHDMFSYGYTGSGGTGLYPDEGSRGILWTSNLVHHTKTSALSQHYGRDNFFHNNIFAFSTKTNSSVAGRWRIEPHTSLICSNNVFVWSGKEGRRAWSGPGGRPSTVKDLVMGSNLWWSPDPIGTNAFNYGTWEDWQKSGMDQGSLLADPLFRDWEHGDWRLKPESPAFKIGFREWDYTLAGVRKADKAWRAKAAAIKPAAYEVAPVPPLNPGRRSVRTGFETRRPGSAPRGLFDMPGSSRQHGYIMESTRAHRTGRQALEVRDFAGLRVRYWPHFSQRFIVNSETFQLRYSLKSDALADFSNEWRLWDRAAPNGTYFVALRLNVKGSKFHISGARLSPDGKRRREAIAIPEYKVGDWCDLVFTIHAPKTGTPTWDFAFTAADGRRHEEKGLGFLDKDCPPPDWIGFMSNADCETVTFLDDYSYENL